MDNHQEVCTLIERRLNLFDELMTENISKFVEFTDTVEVLNNLSKKSIKEYTTRITNATDRISSRCSKDPVVSEIVSIALGNDDLGKSMRNVLMCIINQGFRNDSSLGILELIDRALNHLTDEYCKLIIKQVELCGARICTIYRLVDHKDYEQYEGIATSDLTILIKVARINALVPKVE